jgi:ferredoxin--NADP+ reductase
MAHSMAEPIQASARPARFTTRVLGLKRLSPTGYELSIERQGLGFAAGQLITIHGESLLEDRSYTICSGEHDDLLQVVFRLIPAGKLTPRLAALRAGDTVEVSGPYGEFTIRDAARKIVFIATGTGVAPCRSFVRSRPGLDITLLHGVRRAEDLFYKEEFAAVAYHPCVSGERGFGFEGRVTDYLRRNPVDPASHFYLCGANEMFYDARDVLEEQLVPATSIFTEAYYYRTDA